MKSQRKQSIGEALMFPRSRGHPAEFLNTDTPSGKQIGGSEGLCSCRALPSLQFQRCGGMFPWLECIDILRWSYNMHLTLEEIQTRWEEACAHCQAEL